MTHSRRISVVVPTRDRCALCKRAVRSALEQTPQPVEVIVCDDGSQDATQAVFESWAADEPRLRYVRLPEPSGLPAIPRNAGLAHARGSWIAFLDDDDLWLPGKLDAQLTYVEDFDVVATNALTTRGEPYFSDLERPRHVGRAEVIRANPIVNSTAMVRHALIDEVGGFRTSADLAGIEDYCLWLDLADAGARFVVLPTLSVVYRTDHPERISSSAERTQRRLASHFVHRARQRPRDVRLAAAAGVQITRVLMQSLRAAWGRLRRAA